MTEQSVTIQTALHLGLSEQEFERIIEVLGRMPNFTELSTFSVMWSEQCSYKSSLYWLKTLPREGKRISFKDQTGQLHIDQELICAFQLVIQHWSVDRAPEQDASVLEKFRYAQPYTLGVSPTAALHSLRFGPLNEKHISRLVRKTVSEFQQYDQTVGISLSCREGFSHALYQDAVLINTLSIGVAKPRERLPTQSGTPGDLVFLAGAVTQKGGLRSALLTLAGQEGSNSNATRDPINLDTGVESKLLKVTQEAVETGAIIGIHPVGKAGIIFSMAAMSAKGELGMAIDLEKIPTSPSRLQPFEILLSECSGRLLLVVQKGIEDRWAELFHKRDLACVQIGTLTDSGTLEFKAEHTIVAEVPAYVLIAGRGAPLYERTYAKPNYLKEIARFKSADLPQSKDYLAIARKIVACPNIGLKHWVRKGCYSASHPLEEALSGHSSDAMIIPLEASQKMLLQSMRCNSNYVYANPYVGTMIAVAEAARNIVCSGGDPLAVTYGLSFGDPADPEISWQFMQAVKGMGEACKKLDTPVSQGEVRFHNQQISGEPGSEVYPTPMIGMVGTAETIDRLMTLDFKREEDQIYMIGTPTNDIGCSVFLRLIHQVHSSPAPRFDLDEECHVQQNLKFLIRKQKIESAHDISEGGLFVALLESALAGDMGFTIETDGNFRKDAYLFGEAQSRVIVSVKLEMEDEFVNFLNAHNVSFTKLGEVSGKRMIIDEEDFGSVGEWKSIYENILTEQLEI